MLAMLPNKVHIIAAGPGEQQHSPHDSHEHSQSLSDGRMDVGTHLPLMAKRYAYLSLLGEGSSAQVGYHSCGRICWLPGSNTTQPEEGCCSWLRAMSASASLMAALDVHTSLQSLRAPEQGCQTAGPYVGIIGADRFQRSLLLGLQQLPSPDTDVVLASKYITVQVILAEDTWQTSGQLVAIKVMRRQYIYTGQKVGTTPMLADSLSAG